MHVALSRCCSLVMACASVVLCVDGARAQVPTGHAVVGTFSGPSSFGTSGLFLVPTAGGMQTPVAGLPPALQQAGGVAYQQGVAAVAFQPLDGTILVGTVSSAGSPLLGAIDLFLLQLTGASVDPARTRQIPLGTTNTVGGAWVAPMPDGRVLVLASDNGVALTTGPMAGSYVAIVDVSGPVPAFTFPTLPAGSGVGAGVGGGIVVDATGRAAYYVITSSPGSTNRTARLYRWDFVTDQVCVIASWPGLAKGLVCDDDGTVYVSSVDAAATTHAIHTVHPDGCNQAAVSTQTSSLLLAPAGLVLDRALGRFVVATGGFFPGLPSGLFNSLVAIDRSGAASVVAAPPPGGWGLMAASVAANDAIASYGPRSDGQHRYWFDNFPNPGGQPTLGNAGFSLTMASAPGAAPASALALSFGHGSLSVLGIELLVDPGSTVLAYMPAVPFGLPIPGDPGLAGLSIYAQSLHVEVAGSLAASRGLMFTIQ